MTLIQGHLQHSAQQRFVLQDAAALQRCNQLAVVMSLEELTAFCGPSGGAASATTVGAVTGAIACLLHLLRM